MFWNDPIQYGATFPYQQEFAMQQNPFLAQMLPWQRFPLLPQYNVQFPQYAQYPPNVGHAPYLQNLPFPLIAYNSFLPHTVQQPYQFPYLPQLNWLQAPQLGWQRPFVGC
jgi:hypothetical protein